MNPLENTCMYNKHTRQDCRLDSLKLFHAEQGQLLPTERCQASRTIPSQVGFCPCPFFSQASMTFTQHPPILPPPPQPNNYYPHTSISLAAWPQRLLRGSTVCSYNIIYSTHTKPSSVRTEVLRQLVIQKLRTKHE